MFLRHYVTAHPKMQFSVVTRPNSSCRTRRVLQNLMVLADRTRRFLQTELDGSCRQKSMVVAELDGSRRQNLTVLADRT